MPDIATRLAAALADRYRIERELGAGGMATVYLAEDVKHKRRVAVKVLKPELAAVLGAERFVHEITTTASLQHPHILPLFDSGTADGFLFYVMPFIDGETLRAKLSRETQFGVDEAVRIASDVADALHYAHTHGVIHRDIKPENILLHDGRPMVADFGIALAVSAAAGGRMTETGLSLGTPHYMSPEQATAEKEITARSDTYSLATVLYEMLTGEPPHMGNSAQAIIMKIVTEDAQPVTRLRKSVPQNVTAAVAKALERLPADRFESAKAFADALANPSFTIATGASGRLAGLPPRRMAVSIVSLAALVIVTTALAVWGWLRPGPAMGVARYGLAFLPGQELVDGDDPSFALAPDGSWIVYVGPAATGNQLWIKRRDALAATPVPGTNQEGVTAPAVSPDGEWIVFQVGSQLRKVPRDGGSPITVADSVEQSTRGVAWLDDGTIVYHTGNRLRRVSHLGGTAEVIWSSTAPAWAPRLPAPLPSARGVLFSLCDDPPFRCAEQSVWVLDFRSGEAEVLERDASRAWYTPTGHVVFVRRDGGVFAAPFDLGSLKLTGPAVPVLEGVKVDRGFYPDFAMSPSGSLLMLAGSGARIGANAEAVWVYRDGRVAPVDSLWRFRISGNFGGALSPDGTRLAITLFGEGNNDIWIKELKELERGPLSRLTHNPGVDMRPRWKPDGRSVSFVSVAASEQGANGDVFVRRADGTLPANLLLDFEEYIHEALWSSDGKWLVLRTGGTVGTRDIWAQRVGVDSAPRRLLASDFDELAVALSPDGRWLAYQSDETGETEVYVRPFPDITADKVTVSVGGGSRPLWSHSGRELFYVNAGDRQMIAARIRTTPTFGVVERRPLFPLTGYFLGPSYTAFDISPDDQRFLMIRQLDFAQGASAPMLVLVENWFEELRARMAGGR